MEKMLMKISKEDFLVLTAMAEFHMKFSEYIREQDESLFFRAVDYAKTYAKVEGLEFDYWHENNKKFLDELSSLLEKKKYNFERLVEKLGSEVEAKKMWIKRKKTTATDPLGMKNYIDNFKRHAGELNYQEFDVDDWKNFVGICKHIKDDEKFITAIISIMKEQLGENNMLYKEMVNGQAG
jgi:hypothetical protein